MDRAAAVGAEPAARTPAATAVRPPRPSTACTTAPMWRRNAVCPASLWQHRLIIFHPGSLFRIFSIPDRGSDFFPSRIPYPKFPSRIPYPKFPSRIPYPKFPSRILDPKFFHPGSRIRIFSPGDEFFPSRIRIREFVFYPNKFFLNSRKYDPGCSYLIRILIFSPSQIPDPGLTKLRIPDPNPQHWINTY